MYRFEKKRPGAVKPPWAENTNRSLWGQYAVQSEPTLDDVLNDPIVKALAASDHVSRSEIDKLVKIIREYRASR